VFSLFIILSCTIMQPLEDEEEMQYQLRQEAAQATAMVVYQQTAAALQTQAASIGGTQTAIASVEAEWHAAQTAEAAQPAPQIDAPPEAQAGHAPKILNVDIARMVPADGTKVGGTIIFEDAAQDVVLLRADVLAASLTAESWTYDPRQNMVWSGTRGIAAFQVWCTGDPQDVSYSYTLEDAAGNVSAPWQVSYTCK
jgi:hypothetical protein